MPGEQPVAGSCGVHRTTTPKLSELLGTFEAWPQFNAIAVVVDRAARKRQLVWPMPLPFCTAGRPDFVRLFALYCNHLAYLLARPAESAAAQQPTVAFYRFVARCHAESLPVTCDRTQFADDVIQAITHARAACAGGSDQAAFAGAGEGPAGNELLKVAVQVLPAHQLTAADDESERAVIQLYRRYCAQSGRGER